MNEPRVRISGVILAAGLSRRMGSPKALLRWEGETYLDRLIRIFAAACDEVIVVLRPDHDKLLAACARLADARIVLNADADRGQFSSLQCGLDAVRGDAVLFTPVDYGHVREQSVLTIVSAYNADEVIQPSYRGTHGHPVLAGPAAMQALRMEPPGGQARSVLRRFHRRFIEIDDPGTVMDADDPASFAAIRQAVL